MEQEGGLFSGRNLLIIAVAAVAAYFLFFRGKSSSGGGATGASGDTTSMGDTTVQTGAVQITVTDNTTQAGNSKPGPGPGLPDQEPADEDDENNPVQPGGGGQVNPHTGGNPQPRPATKPWTVINAAPGGTGHGGAGAVAPRNKPAPRPLSARTPLGKASPLAPPRKGYPGGSTYREQVPRGRPAPKRRRRKPAPRRQPGTFGLGR